MRETDSECASGFCVDGVCCNGACDSQCFSCNQSGNLGYCTAQVFGDDLNAAQPCTGAHTCGIALPVFNWAACRLKDQQACTASSDCAARNCQTYYVDRDADGHGDSNTTPHLCNPSSAAPPGGYVTVGGDCCDSDAKAYSGETAFYTHADGCGAWDYSCDGSVDTWNNQGTAAECGQTVHGSCTTCTQTISCR